MDTLIILAAGKGERLRPLTNELPKCMVKFMDESLLHRNLKKWDAVSDFKKILIGGYCSKKLEIFNLPIIKNNEYSNSNMVWSLLQAYDFIKTSSSNYIYVCYGDILVSSKNINLLVEDNSDYAVLIDKNWEDLWSMRMSNYMDDVESFRYANNKVLEIGKKTRTKEHIQGQYIGVIKYKRELIENLLNSYKNKFLSLTDNKSKNEFKNMYLTDLIQEHIEEGLAVKPVFINAGWLEIDTVSDLNAYEDAKKNSSFFDELI